MTGPSLLTRGPRFAMTAPAAVSTGTPPISLRLTSPVRPGKNRVPSSGLRLAGPHWLRRRPSQRRAAALRRVTHGGHKRRTLTACADADWCRAELLGRPNQAKGVLRGEALCANTMAPRWTTRAGQLMSARPTGLGRRHRSCRRGATRGCRPRGSWCGSGALSPARPGPPRPRRRGA